MTLPLPNIVTARLIEAIIEPTIPRWRSLAYMTGLLVDTVENEAPESPLGPKLRKIADFAHGQMLALHPERVET